MEDAVVADRLNEIGESITKIVRYWEGYRKTSNLPQKVFLRFKKLSMINLFLQKFISFALLEVFLNHF